MKRSIVSVLLVLVMCFSVVACEKDKNYSMDFSNVSVPTPVTAEYEDKTDTSVHSVQLYLSELDEEVKLISHNVMDYGAAANGIKDDYNALNEALKAAEKDGGGVVLMPAGKYLIGKQIVIPSNVTLKGEWLSGVSEGFENGTTILVGVGKGNSSTKTSAAFIKMNAAAKLSGLNIYYHEQNAENPTPYPYTIANNAYLGYTVQNVNIINPYRGIALINHNVVLLENINMSPIVEGIYSDLIYDIPRYSNITVSPELWINYNAAMQGDNSEQTIKNAVSNAVGLRFGKLDWGYLYDLNISGISTGVLFENSENGTGNFNGQFYNVVMKNVEYGFKVMALATIGASIVYADVSATESVVITEKGFRYPAQIFFNSCTFESNGVTILNGGDGALMFTQSTFKNWGELAIDNQTLGFVNADTCSFEKNQSIIARISKNAVSSYFVNCTFATEPKLDYSGNKSGVYISNYTVSEKIPALATNKEYFVAKRKAGLDTVFFASDFGAVADANFLNFNTATDNTKAIQHALNCASSVGGGVVYLEAGNYYVKDWLVIPEGVELKGVSENNRHFGVAQRGTTLVTDHGMNNESAEPFISMSDGAGLTGLNVFYLNQHYAYNIEYPPTVFVAGDNCYLYNVTIPNSYTAVLVKGKSVHIDYLRGMGLKACLVLEGADSAFVENTMITGGDWQDGEKERLLNAPPAQHWTNHPNYFNEGIYVKDCDNVVLKECFVFGMGNGLHLLGEINDFVSIGLGIDAANNSVLMENSGKNNVFVNSELVGNANYFCSTSDYTGETYFYASSCWFGSMDVRSTFKGSGTIGLQQCKIATGGIDVKSATVLMQNFAFDNVSYDMLTVESNSKGYMVNSVGTINLLKTVGESSKFVMENLEKR